MARPVARSSRAATVPQWVPPQLTRLVDAAPEGDQWLHEIKSDAYRLHARLDHGAVTLLTRTGLDWSQISRDRQSRDGAGRASGLSRRRTVRHRPRRILPSAACGPHRTPAARRGLSFTCSIFCISTATMSPRGRCSSVRRGSPPCWRRCPLPSSPAIIISATARLSTTRPAGSPSRASSRSARMRLTCPATAASGANQMPAPRAIHHRRLDRAGRAAALARRRAAGLLRPAGPLDLCRPRREIARATDIAPNNRRIRSGCPSNSDCLCARQRSKFGPRSEQGGVAPRGPPFVIEGEPEGADGQDGCAPKPGSQ